MKNILLTASFALFAVLAYSQQAYKYKLTFENIQPMEVKKAASVLDPLFQANVVLSEDYQIFTYISNQLVEENQVAERLETVGLQLKEMIKED